MDSKEKKITFFKREKLIVGGVPEHFNAPWHLGISNGIFAKHNIDIEFKNIPEGTGKMCAGLADGSLDVAVVLTEGIVKDIATGAASHLVATYVESPLSWGVFVKPDAPIQSLDDLKGKTIGISRFGSGSHLMSYVLAEQKEWNVEKGDLKFEILNNIHGLVDGINTGKADAFMWEQFMTKPWVDRGELRMIGIVVTPWPCFMIAIRKEILDKHFNAVYKMLQGIQESAWNFQNGGQMSIDYVANNYGIKSEDAKSWFQAVRFSRDGAISRRVLVKTVDTLIRAKVIPYDRNFSFSGLYDRRVVIRQVDAEEIKTVQLHYAQRMINELREIGKLTGPLSVDELGELDQLHYFGRPILDSIAEYLGIGPGKKVLDIGSGLGGPARYLAEKYGCDVEALEIEPERYKVAIDITQRCGLSHKVKHTLGDILNTNIGTGFHHFISLLVFLHIEDKRRLFDNCYKALSPGGTFFIEDFVRIAPFTEQEKADLEIAVACPFVPSIREYQKQLELAGFEDIITEDISIDWTEYVHSRLRDFEQNRARNIRVHGEKIIDGLHYFYAIINKLFNGGNLGGIRISGRKGNRL